MQSHDELEANARRHANAAKPADSSSSADIGHALAKPAQASVQTMLEVQRLAGNAGVSKLLQREDDGGEARSPVLDVVGQGGGSPLSGDLKNEMEGRLGGDFSDVKVHTDDKATQSAQAVQANAYTVGNDVVVRSDRWSPSSDEGKKTIAHELTHVMQQRAGPVDGTNTGDGISVSHPSDRFEQAAERNATTAMAAPAPASSGASAQLEVQREEEEPEEMQGEFVQREEEEPEEMQGEFVQREEEEPEEMQGEFVQREEEEPEEMQGEFVQREEEEPEEMQGEFVQRSVQRHADQAEESAPAVA
jgi:uncharacterized protein DUF4157